MPNPTVRATAEGLPIETFQNVMALNRRLSRGTPARDALEDIDFALMHARRFTAKVEGALAALAAGDLSAPAAPGAEATEVEGFPIDDIRRRFEEMNVICAALLARVRTEVAS